MFIVTEDGTFLVTEDDVFLVTEDHSVEAGPVSTATNRFDMTASISLSESDYPGIVQFSHGRQDVGTTYETLSSLGLLAEDWVLLVNRDETNYVSVSASDIEAPLIRLKPGVPALFETDEDVVLLYLKSDTAPSDVEYFGVNVDIFNGFLLLEDFSPLLLEDGSNILLES